MKIVQNKFSDFILPKQFNAITIYPFIFVRTDADELNSFIKHEMIHTQQQKECLLIFFYVIYVVSWMIRVWFNRELAYYNIPFEQEAYNNELVPHYLENRKHFAWIKYMFKTTIK